MTAQKTVKLSKASDEGLKFKLENFLPRECDKRVNEVIIERLMNGKPRRKFYYMSFPFTLFILFIIAFSEKHFPTER